MYIIAISVLVSVVLISGCTSNASYQNYTGKNMSFQYPEGWKLTEDAFTIGDVNNNLTVRINKNGSEICIQVFPDDINNSTMASESLASMESGYEFRGFYKENKTGTPYKVYVSEGGDYPTIYIFKKGNKTFEIIGNNADLDIMDKIVETIS